MQKDSISIRELQKMNAGAIQALKAPLRIKSGSVVVGTLWPQRFIDPRPKDEVDAALQRIAERNAQLTPDDIAERKHLFQARSIAFDDDEFDASPA